MNTRCINIVFSLLLISCSKYCTSQSDSLTYVDTSENEKRVTRTNWNFELGIATHEVTFEYQVSPTFFTAQIEAVLSLYGGISYLHRYFQSGILIKKGILNSFDQSPGFNQVAILSKPWIFEANGALNLFFFRKRNFFLGPMINYIYLNDSKFNYTAQIVGVGIYFRKKWFTCQLSFHNYLTTNVNNFNIDRQKSISRSIGVIVPFNKVVKKKLN